jgi:hypothetical protein
LRGAVSYRFTLFVFLPWKYDREGNLSLALDGDSV